MLACCSSPTRNVLSWFMIDLQLQVVMSCSPWKSRCVKELRGLPGPPIWVVGLYGTGSCRCSCWVGAYLQPKKQSPLWLVCYLVTLLMLSQGTLKLQGLLMTCRLHKLQGMGFDFRKHILWNTFIDFCPQNKPLVSVHPVFLAQIMSSLLVVSTVSP